MGASVVIGSPVGARHASKHKTKLLIRLTPELMRQAKSLAQQCGLRVQDFAAEIVEAEIARRFKLCR